MKKRTIYITLFLIFIIGVISLIGTFAIDSSITEGNSSKADYLFNITIGDRTNREITIPSYDSKIVDIKISNPNEFNMSYLLYLEGINSNISIINISDTDTSGVLNSKNTNLVKVFIQNNSSTDTTVSIKDIVGFEKEILELPSNNTSINKGTYYKVIVKSNDNTYGKVKPNIKLSTNKGTVKYTLVPNTGYQYKSNTCNGTVANNILTISNITNNASCEVVFEPIQVTVNFDLAGGVVETTYTEPKEYTYTVPATGTYKIELWGAQGLSEYGGKGGYTKGEIKLNQNDNFYVYVGGTNGYNGGGSSSNKSGGGATDVRLTTGTFDNFDSLKSRIMVAAGGGAVTNNDSGALAGNAGGLIGYNGVAHTSVGITYIGTGASQTSGGKIGSSATTGTGGKFGIGGTGGVGPGDPNHTGCGGGGGYYGGGASAWHAGSGGGSSYISGHNGCDAINSDSTEGSITHSGQSVHYSGKTFTNTVMIDGSGYAWTNTKGSLQQMPNPTGGYYASGVGNSGNGVAKISLLSNFSNTMSYGTKYSDLPTPTKAGYSFEGWYTGENGTGTKVTNDTILKNTNTHTLYAKWVIKNVTVNFNSGNLLYNLSDTDTVVNDRMKYSVNNKVVTVTALLDDGCGYINASVYLEANKTYYFSCDTNGLFGYDVETFLMLKSDESIYYRMDSNNNYSFTPKSTGEYYVRLDVNQAGRAYLFSNINFNENISSKTIEFNQKYGTLPTPTRTGYTFDGWYTGEDGKGTKITSDTVLKNSNTHTLYAYWERIQPTEYNVPGSFAYTVPRTGMYKLEAWGAQGGSVTYESNTYRGGYGGYSTGNVFLKGGDVLYLNVGGAGSGGISSSTFAGGYNGGGAISATDGNTDHYHASGGGATHIAIKSGLLSALSGNLDSILIVSGGGGGGYRHTAGTGYSSIGGEGGGIAGTDSTTGGTNGRQGLGGIQTTGGKYSGSSETSSTVFGSFGQGGTPNASWGSAGGGGYYGGGASYGQTMANGNSGGGGGSGYIGNPLLTNKYMYCYNCTTSTDTVTKTYSTTNVSGTPTSDYAKSGNGAIRITFIGADD